MFTAKEVSLLLECLDYYRDARFAPFSPDIGERLYSSCIDKLNSLTALTFFSKAEFSFLSFAVNCELSAYDEIGVSKSDPLYALFLKLQKLCPSS